MEQTGAPALYANIPIINIKNDMKSEKAKEFNDVDPNKKMDDVEKEKNQKEKAEKNIEKNNENKKNDKSETIKQEEKKQNETKEIQEEEDDEEDDDITFDDLLKVAEEEDKKKISEE